MKLTQAQLELYAQRYLKLRQSGCMPADYETRWPGLVVILRDDRLDAYLDNCVLNPELMEDHHD
jgi:hypothetical protein